MQGPLLGQIKDAAKHIKKHGYAVIKDFISKSKCDKAIQEIDRLVDEFEPTPENITIFGGGDTNQASKHLFSKYFLDSSDKVSFFF